MVKFAIININFIAIKPKAILISAFNKNNYINLFQKKIAKIFAYKFQFINLYKLYYIKRYNNIY